LLSGLFLEIGDHLGPVAVYVDEKRSYKNKGEQQYCDTSDQD
jgi:hypothetical protein